MIEEKSFQLDLEDLKQSLDVPFDWYPYDSFGNVQPWKDLLGPKLLLPDLAGRHPALDIGCADGAMSFLLEKQGCQVEAVDLPSTNYNQMQGIRALKEALQSTVEIHEVDLDRQFQLQKTYGLVLFFGILYHLKNPFYALETLARHARFCLLSTRIAAVTPSGQSILKEPVAYLLDHDEANGDCTNFWIFSETGLRRIAERAGWEVRSFQTYGRERDSNPKDGDRDQRAFAWLESRYAALDVPVRLLRGWHPVEDNWRWTERTFSVSVPGPLSPKQNTLQLRFHHIHEFPITLHAVIGGHVLAATTYTGKGEHLYEAEVPEEALQSPSIEIEFVLNRALASFGGDEREMGIIVSFFRERYPDGDQNLPIIFR